ncbi:hypothetical protein [Helicobacter sp. T3_23-1059]
MQIKADSKPLRISEPNNSPNTNNANNPQDSNKVAQKQTLSAESFKTKPTSLENVDSLQKSYHTKSHNLNAINIALGELELMTKTLNSLQKYQKNYEKLALKLEEAQENENDESMQAIEQESQKIYEKMQNLYEGANFNGKNVFSQDYTNILPEVALDGKKANPNTLEIKNTQSVREYANMLKEQKLHAKTARKILYKRAQSEMDELAKTDKSYEKINRDMLLSEEFKAAQGGRGIRAERVWQLLNLH